MKETAPIETLKGIGPKTRQLFEKAGIFTVEDLMEHYPRRYERMDRPCAIASLKEEETAAVCAWLQGSLAVRRSQNFPVTVGTIADKSGTIAVNWYAMPFLANTLKRGKTYIFRGRITRKGRQLLLTQPAVFEMEKYEELQKEMQPVYPLTQGLTETLLKKSVKTALESADDFETWMPAEIQSRYQLAQTGYALRQIHFPKDEYALHTARRRLVFEEFFLFLLSVRRMKKKKEKETTVYQMKKTEEIGRFQKNLGYELTNAQKKVWKEIEDDLQKKTAMARLIQGDVGSGKTVLAVMALLMTAQNGYQGAMMVPTEVLARQHYESIARLFEKNGYPYRVTLLTGSMTAKEKRTAYEEIESGKASVIVGTHALIQERVVYRNLALAVTDEQHRFGVRQREELFGKGMYPHTLVMSATPIPRTLAVIVYGDLDISVVDEMPSNRLPIKNCVVDTAYRQKAYRFIEREVKNGHQAYVICPMVEESEAIEAENVTAYARQLQETLSPEISVACLHGKMKPREKNGIMEKFAAGAIHVLVSTTVVEVGVNVPNATVMMIENAERFGLAQLHQLRGRVGRGKDQGYCIMVHAAQGDAVKKRLEILNESNDGFFIAAEDLKLRGPGDLFGIRQSGAMKFKIADVFQDAKILQDANEAVGALLETDPQLTLEGHQKLKKKADAYMGRIQSISTCKNSCNLSKFVI